MSADPMTDYDKVLYPGRAHEESHPDRLAISAAFYGMDPMPIERCRILELGCGFGGNIIPIAGQYPESQSYGIDLSARAIESGLRTVAALGLKNITLRHGSIMDVTAELGRFDYIIAHGVYSWVPHAVREKILSIFNENLAPQGVAYVSYNAFPGSHSRDLVRDMMLYHVRDFEDPQKRIGQARAILRFLADASDKDSIHGAILRDQLVRVERVSDELLFHDDLDVGSEAFLLHQVVAAAGRHRLQYLGDATFSRRDLQHYNENTKAMLAQFPDDNFMERDQYQDFIDGHGFRRTLLCHADIRLVRKIDPDCIKRFYLSSSSKPVLGKIDLHKEEDSEFETDGGHRLTTNHRLGKAALIHLGSRWPSAIGFTELLDNAYRLVAPEGTNPDEAFDDDVKTLVTILYRAACNGHIDLHVHPPRLVAVPGERPEASLLARRQAEAKSLITNLRHRSVILDDEITREFIILLDGTRAIEQLTVDLASRLAAVGLEPKDESLTRESVERHLRFAANRALLIA